MAVTLPNVGGDIGIWGGEVNNALLSIDDRAVDGASGTALLAANYSNINHTHNPGDSIGQFNLGQLPPGTTITIDKTKAMYGGAAGSWPTTRPTSRIDITIRWKGNTDPGTVAIDGDEWVVTA